MPGWCFTCTQEREIQLRKAELEEVQATSNQYQQRVRELEEQIESDDRAEKLEISLKNTQDRADELEFQLNKIQQVRARHGYSHAIPTPLSSRIQPSRARETA